MKFSFIKIRLNQSNTHLILLHHSSFLEFPPEYIFLVKNLHSSVFLLNATQKDKRINIQSFFVCFSVRIYTHTQKEKRVISCSSFDFDLTPEKIFHVSNIKQYLNLLLYFCCICIWYTHTHTTNNTKIRVLFNFSKLKPMNVYIHTEL